MRQFSLAVLAIGIVALVGILAFMLGRGMPSAPTPTVYVIPTVAPAAEVAESTSTDRPTRTPRPTNTSTATLGATATTTATITPTATANPQLAEYANHRDDAAYFLRTVKADIDPTFGKVIEGKVSPQDRAWQASVTTLFDEFDADVNWFADNPPPDAFQESHETTLTGIRACSAGFRELYYGAVDGDNERYQNGVAGIGVCNQYWDQGDYMFWRVVLDLDLEWPQMSDPTLAP